MKNRIAEHCSLIPIGPRLVKSVCGLTPRALVLALSSGSSGAAALGLRKRRGTP